MKRILLRVYHLMQRIIHMTREFPSKLRTYGFKVACASFIDGLIPPGKSQKYISVISDYVNRFAKDLADDFCKHEYSNNTSGKFNSSGDSEEEIRGEKEDGTFPIWCCWWQGESQMPELVQLCQTRLKQLLPDHAELHLITLDNYMEYVEFPEHIMKKFRAGIITMTTLSDVLRFLLLEKYGGYWLDATVFFTGDIPEEYFTRDFYCQKMTSNSQCVVREACRCKWCGFSMAGKAHSVVFQYMNAAFSKWWSEYDSIIDYVLIDYLLWSGYTQVPQIRSVIDSVPDNNEDIFELYQVLNRPYSEKLYRRMTKRNVMHKLTYKMELSQYTEDGRLTMYGYLHKKVYEGADK